MMLFSSFIKLMIKSMILRISLGKNFLPLEVKAIKLKISTLLA